LIGNEFYNPTFVGFFIYSLVHIVGQLFVDLVMKQLSDFIRYFIKFLVKKILWTILFVIIGGVLLIIYFFKNFGESIMI